MFTDGYRTLKSSYLVKFSDDTTLQFLLQGLESDHGCALLVFAKWSDNTVSLTLTYQNEKKNNNNYSLLSGKILANQKLALYLARMFKLSIHLSISEQCSTLNSRWM